MQNMTDETMTSQTGPLGERDDDSIDLMRVFATARRRWLALVMGMIIGVSLGVAHVATTTSLYTSAVHISIGSADADSARELSGVTGVGLGEDQITTEIQVLKSEQIAERVVDALELVGNDQFLTEAETGIGRVASTLKSGLKGTVALVADTFRLEVPDFPPTEAELAEIARLKAVSILRGNIEVSPVQRSSVLKVSYTSVTPRLSARVANAIAEAYIEDQLASKYEATQRATEWLKERSDQLRVQSSFLDNAVEIFRRENNLLGVGGSLSSDKELERLNQQVSMAKEELLTLRARSRRLDEIVVQNDTSAAVSSTATQSITSDLRARYLETLRDYNGLVFQLGDEHEQTLRRFRELTQLEGLMFEEIKRSAAVAVNDVGVAIERLASLEQAQDVAAARLGADNTVVVELRELERSAETVRSLYTSFLQRYQQSLQEQGFPVSDARVLNPARVSEGRSSPNLTRTTILMALLGFFAAAAWVAFREVLDNQLRTESQLREVLGLEYLGGLALLNVRKRILPKFLIGKEKLGEREIALPDVMLYAVDHPLSNFAETLRTGKMSVTLKRGDAKSGQIIGVVSCFPGEGKTTVSANMASLLASQGASVMLIDGDLRNPGLTRALGGEIEHGLVEVLLEDMSWRDAFQTERKTGVHILANKRGRVVHTSELLGGADMERLLDELAQEYDYIIIDLPPLGPVIDARAVLHKLDGVFFVAKWGGTNINYIENILRSDPRIRAKCYGAFLNMFDAKKAHSYGYYEGSSYYYGKAYTRYYHD